jgi:hypothetical protein
VENAEKPRRRPHRLRASSEEAIAAIRDAHGLLAPAALKLGMSRSNLMAFVRNHSRVAVVLKEERAKMGDFTESKLFELIKARDYRAIAFYLSTQCKDRGYALSKGTALNAEVSNVTIGTVNILPIRSGEYLASDPNAIASR